MATSAPNTTPDPRPTGDLEHLFRQKFAEAEVTPRAGLWEQLDNELLVEQNNTYRRKLSVHRWVAAACLLFLLGVGSWLTARQWRTAGSEVATREGAAKGRSGLADHNQLNDLSAADPAAVAANTRRPATLGSTLPGAAAPLAGATSESAATLPTQQPAAASTYQNAYAAQLADGRATPGARLRNGTGLVPTYQGAGLAADAEFARTRYANNGAGFTSLQVLGADAANNSLAAQSWNGLAPRFAYLRGGWLGGRPDTLKASLLAVPQPNALAAAPDEPQQPAKQWRRLRLGGSFAAAAYNPNINFSRNDGRVNADAITSALRNYYQDDAETEYRRNLRAGVSQRVALNAAYTLNKHWTLLSGVEAAQQNATSATSYGFVDGRQVSRQVADLFANTGSYPVAFVAAVAPTATRKTSYRYRTVTVPVEIRYGSARPGTTLYAKVGTAVGLLLGTRSKLEGSPDATRSYSLSSSDSPYRQVLTSVRGGAGVRYQPVAASWSLALGTTTELGLTTLNANPSQRVLRQSRPYSVGVEASVEFGSAKHAPVAP